MRAVPSPFHDRGTAGSRRASVRLAILDSADGANSNRFQSRRAELRHSELLSDRESPTRPRDSAWLPAQTANRRPGSWVPARPAVLLTATRPKDTPNWT